MTTSIRRHSQKSGYVTEASFALKSDDLDPVRVTEILGLSPTRSWKKGDPFENLSGLHIRSFGIWRLATGEKSDSESLKDHIEILLADLEPRSDLLREIAREFSATANVNLWWNARSLTEGYDLPSLLMARLCSICDRIDFVFHCERTQLGQTEDDDA